MAEYIFEINDALYNEKKSQAVMKPEYKGKLVRCKDCKWYETFYTLNGNEFRCCCRETKDSLRNSDDYCSLAERRGDG